MIPEIDIKIKECSELGYDLSRQSNWIIGQAYCYEWDATKEAALKQGINLDSFLTFQIGYHLAIKNPKGKFLVWYVPFGEMFFLTVTRKGKTIPTWMADIAGYREQGQDYLKENSRPFLYYDGLNVTRVHFVSETIEQDAYYISDLGNMFGLNVARTEKDNYEDIRDNASKYYDCAVVSSEAIQIAEWMGKKIVINHAFCRLV
ncbi:MAG: hypothetical protein HZB31_01525 [Nitrospirae bacterium]|nr:hypothetical protein [Nitrospirota bacterium]